VGIIILTPGPGIGLVGRDDIVAIPAAVTSDGIGVVHAYDPRPPLEVECRSSRTGAFAASVEPVASLTVILVAQGQDVGDGRAGDVQSCQCVVFLQGNPGSAGVGGDGDVLRLHVPGHAGEVVGAVGHAVVPRTINPYAALDELLLLRFEL